MEISELLGREREALAVAEAATRARDDVLRVVSHDLGNSLSAIVVTTSVLLRTLPEREADTRGRITGIRHLAEQMQRLRQDLLDVASIEAGALSIERGARDPGALIGEAIEHFAPLAADKGLALLHRVPDGLPAVLVDRERILQVLANLLGNAVKFTPEGGRITVGATGGPAEVCISVADTGPGISAEDLPHVFDRFWKTGRGNRHGAGLGLAIARGIVDAHGGRIWAESTPGDGSTFRFTLPSAPTP